jgi:hypothetical protein
LPAPAEKVPGLPQAHPRTPDPPGARNLNAVFALGNRASAEDIRARLTHPPSSSSVRVVLDRLEAKGYLKPKDDLDALRAEIDRAKNETREE